jgi:hypothetical protein
MTVIIPEPLYFDDCELKIGTDDYGAAISSAVLTPTANTITFTGLKPGAEYHAGRVTWTLDLTFAQDWGNSASLSRKLWNSQGTVIEDCTIKPITGDTPEFTVDLFITPGAVGGQARAHATATVSLPVKGQPTFADA